MLQCFPHIVDPPFFIFLMQEKYQNHFSIQLNILYFLKRKFYFSYSEKFYSQLNSLVSGIFLSSSRSDCSTCVLFTKRNPQAAVKKPIVIPSMTKGARTLIGFLVFIHFSL